MGDKLFLNFNAKFQHWFMISHVKLQNVTAMFGTKFLDTIQKSKTHDCRHNLSPMILKGNQMLISD